jgi:hypothetical protein
MGSKRGLRATERCEQCQVASSSWCLQVLSSRSGSGEERQISDKRQTVAYTLSFCYSASSWWLVHGSS